MSRVELAMNFRMVPGVADKSRQFRTERWGREGMWASLRLPVTSVALERGGGVEER